VAILTAEQTYDPHCRRGTRAPVGDPTPARARTAYAVAPAAFAASRTAPATAPATLSLKTLGMM